jgi:DNA-binding MarR family transcriptional regulator
MDEMPFREDAEAIASLLPALIRRLFAVDDQLAAQLPVAQLRVCGMLYDGGPQRMSALGRAMGVSLSAMTQIADRLERAGLVNRVAEGGDRRIRCLQLTPRGQKVMQRRQQARVERVTALLEQLSPQDRKTAISGLQLLLEACAIGGEEVSLATGDCH